MRKIDWLVILLCITGFLAVYLFSSTFDISESIGSWMTDIAFNYGYFGAFLISIIGNFTILFPIPYVVAIFSLGVVGLNPWMVGLASGLGATIGEFSSYGLGRGMTLIQVQEKYGKRLDVVKSLLTRKGMGFFTVFIFAATPLPDDILMIPLGMVKYPFRRAVLASFLGKIILTTSLAIAGTFYATGVTLFLPTTEISDPLLMGLTTVIVILGCYLLIRVDWLNLIQPTHQAETTN